jgi:hypothetical protein
LLKVKKKLSLAIMFILHAFLNIPSFMNASSFLLKY